MNKKLFVTGTEVDRSNLKSFIRQSTDARSRHRAQAILWSMEGRERKDLASLFHVKADTISAWFGRWDPGDLSKLSDAPRPGRPSRLTGFEKKAF